MYLVSASARVGGAENRRSIIVVIYCTQLSLGQPPDQCTWMRTQLEVYECVCVCVCWLDNEEAGRHCLM